MRLTPLSIAALALCALTATVGATTNEKGAPSAPVARQATKPRTFMAWKKKAAPEPEGHQRLSLSVFPRFSPSAFRRPPKESAGS